MIGGRDIFIALPWGESHRRRILHIALCEWPEAVYEDATFAYRAPVAVAADAAPPSGEFFLYRDPEAAKLWDSWGAAPVAADSMLHVLGTPEGITLVAGSAAGTSAGLAEVLRTALERALDGLREIAAQEP